MASGTNFRPWACMRRVSQTAAALLALLVIGTAVALAGEWLPGDTHSHISPPDVPPAYDHAKNDLEGAIKAGREAGLKWLIITPHAMHQKDPQTGQPLHEMMARKLRERKPTEGDPLVVLGWEHTRNWPGHMTVSFMDLAQATKLGDYDLFKLARRARGLLIVAHPYQLPSIVDKANRSWKPWTAGPRGQEMDSGLTGLEIRHSASPAETAAAKWDEWIGRQKRRIIGVGATDDHEGVLFATTWVYIDGQLTSQSLHEALLGGRIIAGGSAEAGSFTVTSDLRDEAGNPVVGRIGDAIDADRRITVNWEGEGRLFINGQRGTATRGPVSFTLPEKGSFCWVRLEVGDDSYANPVYVNLPQQEPEQAEAPAAAPAANREPTEKAAAGSEESRAEK